MGVIKMISFDFEGVVCRVWLQIFSILLLN
jgi:hypothetical protein